MSDDGVGSTEARRVRVPLRWRTSALAQALFVCAAAALAAALMSGRWQLIAFAAPLLGVLSTLGWRRPPDTLTVRAHPALLRCFEGEQAQIAVELVLAEQDIDAVAAELTVIALPGMGVEVPPDATAQGQTVALTAERWGRYPLRVRIDVIAPGGLLTATADAEVADVFVFPLVPPPSTGLPRTELPDRFGTHLTRHVGPGVEYADIRPYVPGDHLRTVNWAVSARRGSLHVTQRLTDRAVDVVALIDLSRQPPGPATAATERSVEGAVQVVQSALRGGDRAGVVVLGGQRPRWLGPDLGQRQFYRVLDAVLGAGSGFRAAEGTLAPQAAVPPGAVVIAFSTLLESSFGLALNDLAKRGHTVVVIDVLEGYPLDEENDPIMRRMWALQRSAMHRDMSVVGVDVLSWPAGVTLDQAMRLLPQAGRSGSRRRAR